MSLLSLPFILTSNKTQKETVKETTKEQPRETQKEETIKETNNKKAKVTYDYETKIEKIPYKTIRRHNIPNTKTRVKQNGVNGKTINTYKITFENEKEVRRNITDTKTIKAQDEIIETYVKIQDKKVETREVEDKSKPVYRVIGKERWFVKNDATGETTYHYSAKEAENKYVENLDKGQLSSWGTAESEKIKTNEIIGYQTKTAAVVVQEEKWAWQ